MHRDLSTRRALVIEDDADIRALLAEKLSRIGFHVETVNDGPAGLAAALANPPDVVLLDWMLSTMSGPEILERLRSNEVEYVPVIMVSARVRPIDIDTALACGADDYLIKPFSLLELESRVGGLLSRSQQVPLQPRPRASRRPAVVAGTRPAVCVD
ncbi:MAG: response regulator transcription factor [Actinomycetota bacterium]